MRSFKLIEETDDPITEPGVIFDEDEDEDKDDDDEDGVIFDEDEEEDEDEDESVDETTD